MMDAEGIQKRINLLVKELQEIQSQLATARLNVETLTERKNQLQGAISELTGLKNDISPVSESKK